MKKVPKYPDTILVQIQNQGTQDEYLQAELDAVDLKDGVVAVYRLEEIHTKRTQVHLD